MTETPGSPPTAKLLWLRLSSLAIFGLVFAEAMDLASGKIRGWSFYLTPSEIAFESFLRLIVAALAGIALAAICLGLLTIVRLAFKVSPETLLNWSTKIAVIVIVFLATKAALAALLKSSYAIFPHRRIFDVGVLAAFYLTFIAAVCFPRARSAMITSLAGLLGRDWMRRSMAATLTGAIALGVVEFTLVKASPKVKVEASLGASQKIDPSPTAPRAQSNILLISFDALTAEDMSLYGYRLPTTPRIDAFARNATVFTRFYSASTFTTPCVATMLTGMYPSATHVYQLQGKLGDSRKSLPSVLRAGGYVTASFFSNPFAYFLAATAASQFVLLPQPVFEEGMVHFLWNATIPFHRPAYFGNRLEEYRDLSDTWGLVSRYRDLAYASGLVSEGPETSQYVRFRAASTFKQARAMLSHLPDGFFLWVHVMTPHDPYLPDPQDRGRFLPRGVQQISFEQDTHWKPHYQPGDQKLVDKYRLRYDEFVLTADRAFGAFMSDLEQQGKLQNTVVIVSADHGESFEGGVFQHDTPDLTRPVIHIPLIIKTPNQQTGRTVSFPADQTALAPTIVQLAGLGKPDWMQGKSLVQWLTGNEQNDSHGLAFTQYLEKNSIFGPLRHGAVGVVDDEYQFVYDLDTRKGALRPLDQAQFWNLDRTSDDPARAEALRAAIFSRFPELRH